MTQDHASIYAARKAAVAAIVERVTAGTDFVVTADTLHDAFHLIAGATVDLDVGMVDLDMRNLAADHRVTQVLIAQGLITREFADKHGTIGVIFAKMPGPAVLVLTHIDEEMPRLPREAINDLYAGAGVPEVSEGEYASRRADENAEPGRILRAVVEKRELCGRAIPPGCIIAVARAGATDGSAVGDLATAVSG